MGYLFSRAPRVELPLNDFTVTPDGPNSIFDTYPLLKEDIQAYKRSRDGEHSSEPMVPYTELQRLDDLFTEKNNAFRFYPDKQIDEGVVMTAQVADEEQISRLQKLEELSVIRLAEEVEHRVRLTAEIAEAEAAAVAAVAEAAVIEANTAQAEIEEARHRYLKIGDRLLQIATEGERLKAEKVALADQKREEAIRKQKESDESISAIFVATAARQSYEGQILQTTAAYELEASQALEIAEAAITDAIATKTALIEAQTSDRNAKAVQHKATKDLLEQDQIAAVQRYEKLCPENNLLSEISLEPAESPAAPAPATPSLSAMNAHSINLKPLGEDTELPRTQTFIISRPTGVNARKDK